MILVTGATGNVGGELARALAADGQPVRGLVRDGRQAALPAGVEPAVGDLNRPESLAGALAGVRAMFLLPGYPGMALQWVDQLRAGDLVQAPFAGVPVAVVDPYDIAAVAARALTGDGHEGQAYLVTGPPCRPPTWTRSSASMWTARWTSRRRSRPCGR